MTTNPYTSTTHCGECGCNLKAKGVIGKTYGNQIVCSELCHLEAVKQEIADTQDHLQMLKGLACNLECRLSERFDRVYE